MQVIRKEPMHLEWGVSVGRGDAGRPVSYYGKS